MYSVVEVRNRHKWVNSYKQINSSFDKTLVYRIGIEAGFFSEFNNMILAILYCLKYKIKFVLYSRGANFSYKYGWEDYFLPFCSEKVGFIYAKDNRRSYQIRGGRLQRLRVKIIKKIARVDYLTQDVWDAIRSEDFAKSSFYFPELGINGSLLEATEVIVNNIWTYRPDVEDIISQKVNALKLPNDYIGVHVRAGDKIMEHKLYGIESYVMKIKDVTDCEELFIATDDYNKVEEFRSLIKFRTYTLCDTNKSGYNEAKYNKLDAKVKKIDMLNLLVDIEILTKSMVFVGTYSSNVGMYIGMRRGNKKCYGIDFNDWVVW